MKYTLIDQTIYNARQSWYASEIRTYETKLAKHSLRANICRNAYNDQSWANIEAFSATNGWVVLASHPVTDFPVASLSYTTKELTEEMGIKVIDTVSALFDIGERFFGL